MSRPAEPEAGELRRFPVPPALAGERLDRALAALVPEMSRSEAQRGPQPLPVP